MASWAGIFVWKSLLSTFQFHGMSIGVLVLFFQMYQAEECCDPSTKMAIATVKVKATAKTASTGLHYEA